MSEAGKQRALEALRAAFATQGSDGLLDRALAVQVGMDYLTRPRGRAARRR